jgi:sigma-B regulation protein RsbU (phosphoserine phosphatase)
MAPRILVVDDNADNRDVLTRRLHRLGYAAVDTAADGHEALAAITDKAAQGAPYDTVLLDVMMPGLTGVQVLERLAADALLAQTPVIMISAATEIETVVRCIELGAEDYLPKPFNPTLLRARLGAVLEKKRLRDEVARQLLRLENELAEARRQQLSMVPTCMTVSKRHRACSASRLATCPARVCRPRCSWRARAACCALQPCSTPFRMAPRRFPANWRRC